MLSQERYEAIINLLKNKEIVKLKDIVNILAASESTIRRDLSYLEEQGFLKRVHGGAALLENSYEADFTTKNIQNKSEKERIGKMAAELVIDGECIFLDAGTTTGSMIASLQGKDITVVTNGVTHIPDLMRYNIKTYLTGGKLKNTTGALIGPETIESIKKYNFNKSFLGTNGIDLNAGYSTPDIEEAEVKKAVINSSKKVYILGDSTKFGKVSFISFGDIESCSIITERIPESKYSEKTQIKECGQ